MDYIEITDSESDGVKQFHDVLVEAFPDPCEREDVEILRWNLRQGSWTTQDEVCRYHLIIARQGGRAVGGASFYFYSNEQNALGMGAYLAVRRELWGKGTGAELIHLRDRILSRDALELNCHLKGLIIQVSDPELMGAAEMERDVMDPSERVRFWKQRGYRKIDFDFIQPPIREGEPPVEYLSLYLFPYRPEWESMACISRAELRNVIDCFIKCTGTPGPPETDPSYIQMRAELATRKHFQML